MDPPDSEQGAAVLQLFPRDLECCTTGNGTSMRAALSAQLDSGRMLQN
jgi:hypothetical protein